MTVAVLALQGAFIEHEHVLEELGVKTVELRQAASRMTD
jgi:5'-phosphate synthase pdxT subunit